MQFINASYIQDVLIDEFTDSAGVRKDESRSDKPKKSRSVSFRLDSNTLDELQREADLNQISLNVLVNQALKRYSDWDRYENRIGMMPVPKVMLTLIDKAVDMAKKNGIKEEVIGQWRSEIIKQAAEVAFSKMKDAVWFMKKQYTLTAVLAVLKDAAVHAQTSDIVLPERSGSIIMLYLFSISSCYYTPRLECQLF